MLQREPSGKGKAQFKSIPYDWHSTSITKCPFKIVHGSSKDTISKLSSTSLKTIITVQSNKHSPMKTPKTPLSGRLFVAVGTMRQNSSEDELDTPADQPVPAPRAAKKLAPAARSPGKTHVTTASLVKRPSPQSCTPATPKIKSPRNKAIVRRSPKKAVTTVTLSPLKHNSPIKKSPVKQQTIRSSPVKQALKTKNTPIAKRGGSSQKFVQAMALLEQGCGGGRASSRQSPVKTTPKVGAMAQRIQERLKADQSNWQSNAINKKVQVRQSDVFCNPLVSVPSYYLVFALLNNSKNMYLSQLYSIKEKILDDCHSFLYYQKHFFPFLIYVIYIGACIGYFV